MITQPRFIGLCVNSLIYTQSTIATHPVLPLPLLSMSTPLLSATPHASEGEGSYLHDMATTLGSLHHSLQRGAPQEHRDTAAGVASIGHYTAAAAALTRRYRSLLTSMMLRRCSPSPWHNNNAAILRARYIGPVLLTQKQKIVPRATPYAGNPDPLSCSLWLLACTQAINRQRAQQPELRQRGGGPPYGLPYCLAAAAGVPAGVLG